MAEVEYIRDAQGKMVVRCQKCGGLMPTAMSIFSHTCDGGEPKWQGWVFPLVAFVCLALTLGVTLRMVGLQNDLEYWKAKAGSK